MLRKKWIIKDTIRKISFNKKRFILLLLLIAIGIGFYVGFKSASVNMQKSAKNYYKENNLMDIKISSSTGFSENDYDLIKKIKNVKGVMMVKAVNAKLTTGKDDFFVKAIGINENKNKKNEDYINRLTLTSGKYPTTVNEGLVEEKFLDDSNLKIGDLITLKIDDDKELKAKKIKIVGTVKNVYHASNEIELSTKSQKDEYFIYLDQKNFESNYYDEIYVTINGANKLNTYSQEYEKLVNKYKKKIMDVLTPVINKRHNEVKVQLQNTISSLENNLNHYYTLTLPEDYLNESIKQTSDELNGAKQTLSNLKEAKINVDSRVQIPSFYNFKLETEKINDMANLFASSFLIITIFISSVWIVKIIDEEKKQIATLRAIGYDVASIFFKYITYTLLVCLLGNILGNFIIYKIFLIILWFCYGSFYNIPSLTMTFEWNHVLSAFLITIIPIVLTCILSLLKTIINLPSKIMNFKKRTNKKIILPKRLLPIWKKLSFSNKLVIKNIFRRKKRSILTIIMVISCSILLFSSIYILNSSNIMVKKQHDKIFKYEISAALNANEEDVINSIKTQINQNDNVKDSLKINQAKTSINNYETYVIIHENSKKLNDYITLKNNKNIKLNDNGVIISKNLAKKLNKKENDSIKITLYDKEIKTKIYKISENYVNNYVYISPTLYKKLTGKNINYNAVVINVKNLEDEKITASELSQINGISSVNLKSEAKKAYMNKNTCFKEITLIIIASFSCLLLLVLSTLNYNSKEEYVMVMDLKSLGYSNRQIISYKAKESLILNFVGSMIGIIIGYFISHYFLTEFELIFEAGLLSILELIILTFIFTFLENLYIYHKIKHINIQSITNNNV